MTAPGPLLAIVIAAAIAGCGGDDEGEQTATVTETSTVTETAAAPDPETTTDPEEDGGATPEDPGGGDDDCGEVGGNRIEVIAGDVDCAEARSTASGYDTQGARVQEVGGWTCEGGNAATRPVVFTCSQGGREFVARAPGG